MWFGEDDGRHATDWTASSQIQGASIQWAARLHRPQQLQQRPTSLLFVVEVSICTLITILTFCILIKFTYHDQDPYPDHSFGEKNNGLCFQKQIISDFCIDLCVHCLNPSGLWQQERSLKIYAAESFRSSTLWDGCLQQYTYWGVSVMKTVIDIVIDLAVHCTQRIADPFSEKIRIQTLKNGFRSYVPKNKIHI